MNLFTDELFKTAENNGSARFEEKFVVPKDKISHLHRWVLSSPMKFSSPYPNRRITSLYLDTWAYRCYFDNLDGTSVRAKYRVRCYGTDEARKAVLEVKLRRAQTGYKLRYPITDPALVQRIIYGTVGEARARDGWIIKVSELPIVPQPLALALRSLFPAAETAYNREYYVSMDKQVRLTIDTDIQYRRAGSMAGNFLNDPLIICEIKTNVDSDRTSRFPVRSLPFKVSRNSKYCCAVSFVCKHLVPGELWQPYIRTDTRKSESIFN